MNRLIGKAAALAATACLVLSLAGGSFAAPLYAPAYPQVPGALPGPQSYGSLAMAAYQSAYAMNFEIWQPAGLPPGWYATFDGFPVAQVAQNRWVYGRMGAEGVLVPTDVLVGSVTPTQVPGLTRIAATWAYARYVSSPEFRSIMNRHCDRMGYLNDHFVRTAIAWSTRKPGVWVWLGNRWKKILPRPGEYTWQALKRYRQWLGEELRKNNVWWTGAEPDDLADLARQWGLLWSGGMGIEGLSSFRDSGGDGTGIEGSFKDASAAETPPEEDSTGRWDTDGGDWDTGK